MELFSLFVFFFLLFHLCSSSSSSSSSYSSSSHLPVDPSLLHLHPSAIGETGVRPASRSQGNSKSHSRPSRGNLSSSDPTAVNDLPLTSISCTRQRQEKWWIVAGPLGSSSDVGLCAAVAAGVLHKRAMRPLPAKYISTGVYYVYYLHHLGNKI